MDLAVADSFVIPARELLWSFSTPGGPGGQHANRNATAAELSWDMSASTAVTGEMQARLTRTLGTRLRNGVVAVRAGESRSQWRNRQMARRRLAELLEGALRERRRRVATRPTRASHDVRIADKRRRGIEKRLRKPPEME